MPRPPLPIVPRPSGSLVLRGARRSLGLALGLTAMAACAPHVRELELPGSLCEDADGYEAPCESEIDAWLRTIPEPPPTELERVDDRAAERERRLESDRRAARAVHQDDA